MSDDELPRRREARARAKRTEALLQRLVNVVKEIDESDPELGTLAREYLSARLDSMKADTDAARAVAAAEVARLESILYGGDDGDPP